MALNLRRFGGYLWVPDRDQIRKIDDVSLRVRATGAVVTALRSELDKLEADLLDDAVALLARPTKHETVARLTGWPKSTLQARIRRRRRDGQILKRPTAA